MSQTIKEIQQFEKAREQIHRQMLSAVSHDLKTPLSTIIGALEIITRMSDKLNPEKIKALQHSALGEAYRLDSFITNILDMAKLENGMVVTKIESCVLSSFLQDCLIRLGIKSPAVSITPVGNLNAINTDQMLLGRAVGVLVDNAVKHGGKEAQIILSYGPVDDNKAFIEVRDNGLGIPKGKEEEIFSKYTRYSRNDQQNAGTGLGLSICRQIMNMLSGTVSVKNHPEGGAIFTLQMPQ